MRCAVRGWMLLVRRVVGVFALAVNGLVGMVCQGPKRFRWMVAAELLLMGPVGAMAGILCCGRKAARILRAASVRAAVLKAGGAERPRSPLGEC